MDEMKPEHKPSASEYGQFISECVQAFGITGAKAREIFGSTANGRTRKNIMDDGKIMLKDLPKA